MPDFYGAPAWSSESKPGNPAQRLEIVIKVLDLFCGSGGSSLGAQSAGATIVGGVDLWKTATANFKHNFPKAIVKNSRLEDVSPRKLHDEVGDIDLLLTSPECTNHSCAKGNVERSEESKETALQTLRFAEEFKPKWIVLENVITMRPWSRYSELKSELGSLGYSVSEMVLDASDFGVPQSRRRLFLVCHANGPIPISLKPSRKRKTVADILDLQANWKTSPLLKPGRAEATLKRAERAIAEVGTDTPFLIVYYGSDGSGGWQPLTRPLRTITTLDRFALVTPDKGGHRMRMLQVPELRKAMGYPSKYVFSEGSRRDQIKMLGNGVCPPVMNRIVKALSRFET